MNPLVVPSEHAGSFDVDIGKEPDKVQPGSAWKISDAGWSQMQQWT